ncbi:class I SAM-dependent methyltransferase [Plantibacter sp. YIM 135347]|uniref:class I SAM-dependent methyltransferase n=1 Tax=Plantibacter sp. YIM 135347 TaxID=3423919 RepID=UPI003D34ACB3
MPAFSFDALRRFPDVEAPNLFAVDASDRLILDEAAEAIAAAPAGTVVVLGDHYGALTLGAAAHHGATGIRVHQDGLTGELALAANADATELTASYRSLPFGEELLTGATVVVMQLPRGLDELEEIADGIARWADPQVRVFAGGRIKHLTTTMNDVLATRFSTIQPSLARQKSRVIRASGPLAVGAPTFPRIGKHGDVGLIVAAHGGAFAGSRIDIGTRALLEALPKLAPDAEQVIDLGCGTGVLGVALAKARPGVHVIATDQSAAAVDSTRATIAANDTPELGLAERMTVVRDNGLESQPDESADLILLNPPFHIGSTVHTGLALAMFADAKRVLRRGGTLAVVWNSHLGYRAALERLVGHTAQVSRNDKFTVTTSRRR